MRATIKNPPNDDVENVPPPPPRVTTTTKPLPRLVSRDRIFSQSSNQVRVQHKNDTRIFWLLIRYDWFHVFLRGSLFKSIILLLAIWTGMILAWASIYKAIDDNHPGKNCGLGAPPETISFHGAFAFSLETCTTVGYGLPNGTNAFFELNCSGLVSAIYGQMVWSMLFNAFLTAFLYSHMARSDARGAQVIFADKAVVSLDEDNRIQLQIRCYDADAKHPVVEAHVRLYCVAKDRPVPRPLRVLQPNDELGAQLFLSFPTVISHHIDAYSKLHPPVPASHTTATVHPAGLDLRQVDSAICSREEIVCPVCGESYGTHERWQRHVRYQKMVELKDDYPVETSHLALRESDLILPVTRPIAELQVYFAQHVSEIIVVIEGIDPLLSGTFQALHSYQYHDLVWHEHAVYSPCMQVHRDHVQVDLDEFHRVNLPQTVSQRNLTTAHDFLRTDTPAGNGNVSNANDFNAAAGVNAAAAAGAAGTSGMLNENGQ